MDQPKPYTMRSVNWNSKICSENEGTQRRLPFRERPDHDIKPARKAAGTVEVSLENRYFSINPTKTSLSAESFRKRFSRKQSVSKTPFYSIPILQKIGQSARYRRERGSRPSDMLAAYAAIVRINRTSSPETLRHAPEIQRLRETFRELVGPDRKLPYVASFSVDVVRKFLHDRVFGDKNDFETPSKPDSELTEYCRSTIPRDKLRKELIKVIDSMVEEITDTDIHHVCDGNSPKFFIPLSEPSTLLWYHPFFTHPQCEIGRAQKNLHNRLLEFEIKMANTQAQSDQGTTQFGFNQDPSGQIHAYQHQVSSKSPQTQSKPPGGLSVDAIGPNHRPFANTSNKNHLASLYLSSIVDQTPPLSSTNPSGTMNQIQSSSLDLQGSTNQSDNNRTLEPSSMNQGCFTKGVSTYIEQTRSHELDRQRSTHRTNFANQLQPSSSFLSNDVNQSYQSRQTHINQGQHTSTQPHHPLSMTFPGYDIAQQQMPLYYLVSNPNGQLHLVQAVVPQALGQCLLGTQSNLHMTPSVRSQGSASTISQSPIAYPAYSQATAYNAFQSPLPVSSRAVRPAAPQRLAPLYLKSGLLQDQDRKSESFHDKKSVSTFRPGKRQRARIAAAHAANIELKNILDGQANFTRSLHPYNPLPYRAGAQTIYLPTNGKTSPELMYMIFGGRPSAAKATDRALQPFAENAKEAVAAPWGVLRILNVPYAVTQDEVRAFLGRNAKLITKDFGPAIHLIMDRATGKTMDCYVEFFSVAGALATLDKINSRRRPLKLGCSPVDRVVDVKLSSQEALMRDMFPRAKNVKWPSGKPVIYESNEPFNTGFKCFITGEELVMMRKHAEQPHKSGFTSKSPQRTYECMISTLAKFPWYSVDNYTMVTRNQLFIAACDQVHYLMIAVRYGSHPKLNIDLLSELLSAGLNAPGFSERQRWELCQAAELNGPDFGVSPLSEWWPWEALGRKANIADDFIELYAHFLTLHPTTVNTRSETRPGLYTPFGRLVFENSPTLTMGATGELEREQLNVLLEDVLD